MKKFIYFIGFVFILSALFGIYLFNKKPQDTRNISAEFKLSAEELVKQFVDNEEQANQRFLDRIILVSGRVNEIKLEENNATIFLDSGDPMAGVTCSFYAEEAIKLKDIKINDQISVKGKCTGKLMDVVLNNCSLSQ